MSVSRRRLAVVVAVCALAGCGSDGDAPRATQPAAPRAPSSTGRVITDTQALTLARVLQRNFQLGGSALSGTVVIERETVDFRGRIDFRHAAGTLLVHQRGLAARARRRYYFTRGKVLAQAKPGGTRFVAEPPAPQQDPIHHLIQLVQLLSAKTIDNLQVLQSQGVRYLGGRVLDGKQLDVYRYGGAGATTYMIGARDGLLRRVVARDDDGEQVTTIDLGARGHMHVALPRL